MTFRLLADENLRGSIFRGLLLLEPELDMLRVQDVGLSGADDRTILAWAAERERIVLTRDRATMPNHAAERLVDGESMPGM